MKPMQDDGIVDGRRRQMRRTMSRWMGMAALAVSGCEDDAAQPQR